MAGTQAACERATIKTGSVVNKTCALCPDQHVDTVGSDTVNLQDRVEECKAIDHDGLHKEQCDTDGECSSSVPPTTE